MEDTFKNRETHFETKFAHDEELKFKIVAHRNKLFGAGVAEELGEKAPSGYAASFAEFALGKSSAALIARAVADLQGQGVPVNEVKLWKLLEHCQDESEAEVMAARS